MLGQMSYKLESRQVGETSTTSDTRMILVCLQTARGTEEPLDVDEGREWKNLLKTKY